jgi:uncharacterized PurR-regulated membrane protein YhhQ (DUF165 family)
MRTILLLTITLLVLIMLSATAQCSGMHIHVRAALRLKVPLPLVTFCFQVSDIVQEIYGMSPAQVVEKARTCSYVAAAPAIQGV